MKFKFLAKDEFPRLAKTSGIYAFKKGAKLLYIGKAGNLRERVRNHFSQSTYRDNLFINQIEKIGYIKTDSEIEALILEAQLIKKYQPKYNVVWRDDKNYFYVGITKRDYPRVFLTHQPKAAEKKIKNRWARSELPGGLQSKIKITNQNLKFIGPFIDGKSLKATLKILRKVFPYRSCKNLPKRPCLWYQLSRCPAPCLFETNLAKQIPSAKIRLKKECQKSIKNLMGVLRGRKKKVLKRLKKEMKEKAKKQDFERAVKIRDQIIALERILKNAKIFEQRLEILKSWKDIEKELKKILKTKKRISRIEAYDVSNIVGQQATGSMVTFVKGLPDKNFYRKFRIKFVKKPNDVAMIKEVLQRRFFHPEWRYPNLILIDGGKAQLNAAKLIIKNFKLKIPVIALAKKKNELYIENQKKPILLKNLPREIFNLILQLRDEAHRFALAYHKKLRDIDLRKNF